jgi:hypothetical protein
MMKRLPRPYRETIAALIAAGYSPYDLTLPQWARLTLTLAVHSPQRYTTLQGDGDYTRDSSVGIEDINVRTCHMIDEYTCAGEDAEDGGELDGEREAEC